MQFKEILGREQVKNQLVELVQHNRLSHALLFLGSEGSGALPMAIAFAQYILCERAHVHTSQNTPSLFGEAELAAVTEEAGNDSCGLCPACQKAEKNIHPDLHFSFPAIKRDSDHTRVLSTDYLAEWRQFLAEQPYGNVTDWLDFLKDSPSAKIENAANKQGNITVNECDDILRKLSLRPFESDYKILIMWMPEYLGAQGNRLLKIIEEPPAGTIFIFVAQDETQILPTILSRTQLVKIPLPEDKEVEEYLVARGADPRRAAQAASVAAGNVREALKALGDNDEDWQKIVRTWLNAIYQNNVDSQTKWIDEVNQTGREKQKQLLQYFLHLIEISVRMKFMDKEDVKVLEDSEKAFARTLGNMCELEVLESMTTELNKAVYYIERNANSKLLFHALTIRFYHLIKEKQLILIH